MTVKSKNIIDTVVFDLDGTLLDTLDDLRDAANHVLEKHGLPTVDSDQTRTAVGNGLRVMMKRIVREGEAHPEFEEILDEFVGYYKEHSSVKTKPYDGIIEAMRKFSAAGYKLAIVSNKPDVAVKELAKYYFGEFEIAASGENEKAGIPKKPSPEMVFESLKTLGTDSAHAVYVGDSDVDILTARNSGMPCISVSWGFRTRDQLETSGASHIISSPCELFDAVAALG